MSQSGETADTLAALRYMREQGQHVLSVLNVPESSMSRESDAVLETVAGPARVLALAYLGMKLGENWRELGKYFHKFDAVIGVVIVAAAIWFIWSHWQNRMSSEASAISRQ